MADGLKSMGEHAPWLRKIGLHTDAAEIDFAAMQVYADWLQEKNECDPRVKFWRSLGQYRLCVGNCRPMGEDPGEWVIFNGSRHGEYPYVTMLMSRHHVCVPDGMFQKLAGGGCFRDGVPVELDDPDRNYWRDYWRDYATRREAMMALCVAFCESTADDQEAFLVWLENRQAKLAKERE